MNGAQSDERDGPTDGCTPLTTGSPNWEELLLNSPRTDSFQRKRETKIYYQTKKRKIIALESYVQLQD